MREKIVLLLGDIAHEGVTSQLSTAGLSYKHKLLSSSVANWKTIVRLFTSHDVKMVLGKLTGDVYAHLASKHYESVGAALLASIASRPHRLFAFEELIAGENYYDENEGYDRFWRPPVEDVRNVNACLRKHGVDVLPYRKRAEVTVSAQSFLEEVHAGLLFRLYVPAGRLWGDQMGQLLALFKDYLSKVAGLAVRLDQQSTIKGVIYAFHGAETGEDRGKRQDLAKHFEDFTKLTDLCATNPQAAEELLKVSGATTREIAQIISRYSKEYRRLQLDLKHAREEKVLSIRHRLESELVDVVEPSQQSLIDDAVDALIPNLAGAHSGQGLWLPFSQSAKVSQQNITLNIKPQFIDRIEGVVAQEISGLAQLTDSDKTLIHLFKQHGGEKAAELTSALQELNDDSAPKPGRVTAKQRIKQFLLATADKAGDAAFGVLQAYVEKKMLGL